MIKGFVNVKCVNSYLLILVQLVLKNDRNSRWKRFWVEEVQLSGLPLFVKEAGEQDGQDEHAGDDDGRNDEGQQVVGGGDDAVEDGVTTARWTSVAVLVSGTAGGRDRRNVEGARSLFDRVHIYQLEKNTLMEILSSDFDLKCGGKKVLRFPYSELDCKTVSF